MRAANFAIIILFVVFTPLLNADESNFSAWHNSDKWDVAGDAMLNPDNSKRLIDKPGTSVLINGKDGKCPSLVTKRRDYRDVEVHVEFMVAKGSNSGIIFHGNYEIQILDSYGIKKPTAGHCGGVYPRAESTPSYHHIDKGSPPRVNAAKRPGQWQTMDIIFQAARFDENGKKTDHARFVKVVHNGQVIQEDVEVPYACGPNWERKQYPQGPIIIQGDYGPIAVRNVRIKEWNADEQKKLNVPPEGFTVLFNGKDFTGWHTPPLVKKYWFIEDGVLKSPGLIENWGASLSTKKHYRDFIFMLDFRMPTISDSGINFRKLIPEIPGFGDMEQFNLRSRGGMGHLESYYFLPKETAKKMKLKEEEKPHVRHIDPEVGVWHTVKLTIQGRTFSAEYDGEVLYDKFEYHDWMINNEPAPIRLQKHIVVRGENLGKENPCPIEYRNIFIKELKSSELNVAAVADRTNAATETTVWRRWEQALVSTRKYRNPFKDVTVSVAYSGPIGAALKGLAFWDGDSTFKIRCAFPAPGIWSWQTTCSDAADKGLHDRQGKVYVRPYRGSNPLYKHGFLGVSANRRHLAYADGTPFLWVGDTYWAATTLLSEGGFRRWVDDRASKHFTVLQTNIARFKKCQVDADGNVLWDGDRWNVRFMQKIDREFDYANDKGLILFVNGLIDLKWDLKIEEYQHLVQMIAARYFAHFATYSSSMDDGFSSEHDEINELIDRVTDRHLLTQHTGTSDRHPVKYYDRAYLDYCMSQSGHHGNNDEKASNAAIAWHLNLYNREPHKPVINGEAWYEGMATPEQAAEMGYLSMLSGCFGYTYGVAGMDGDDQLDRLLNRKGAVYMKYLHDFFVDIDRGRCLKPQHELIDNQKPNYRDKSVLAVTEDGTKYVAFLRKGGEIQIDLRSVSSRLSGKWFNATTGEYANAFSTPGGEICSITSCFGSAPSLIVLEVVE